MFLFVHREEIRMENLRRTAYTSIYLGLNEHFSIDKARTTDRNEQHLYKNLCVGFILINFVFGILSVTKSR